MKNKKYLYVKNKRIELSSGIYKEFNKLVCKQKYSRRKYLKHTMPLKIDVDRKIHLEDEVVEKLLIQKLNHILKQLTTSSIDTNVKHADHISDVLLFG